MKRGFHKTPVNEGYILGDIDTFISENTDLSRVTKVELKSALINWEINPTFSSTAIESFNPSLLNGSTITFYYEGLMNGSANGRDEDGDMQFNDVEVADKITIVIDPEEWTTEFEIERVSLPFTITQISINISDKKITLTF